MKLTDSRQMILRSATFYPPAAWVVSATGGRTGFERVSWERNCTWLAEHGYLRANAHGDWYLTDKGEEFKNAVYQDRV